MEARNLMITEYNVSQPAFTARFIPSGIDLDAKKLQKIQDKFSKLTAHYKTDTLTVKAGKVERETPEDYFYVADFYTKNAAPATICELQDFKNWFDIASVDEAAKALTRIFKAGKHIETAMPKIHEMEKHVKQLNKSVNVNRRKAELTNNPVFEFLAQSNENRAQTLTREIKSAENKANYVQNKIQDYPIDTNIMWWKDLLYIN